jgi:hypothetical protein
MQDDLDKVIDGALAAYSQAEPLAGLESRVLTRVRTAKTARRRLWRWALPVPVLAAILVAVLTRKPEPVPVARIAPPPVTVESPALAPPAVPRHFAARPPARTPRPFVRAGLPKQEMFPTPSQLTKEERLLVELAQSHPYELTARPVEAIEIKPIQIAPLQIDGGQ